MMNVGSLALLACFFTVVVAEAAQAAEKDIPREFEEIFAAESEDIKMRLGRLVRQRRSKNWDGVAAVIDEIARLQPKALITSRYIAWMCSYEVAPEQKDTAVQYEWVKRGITLLLLRLDSHPNEPEALWELGNIIGQRLDTSDFRRMFADDVRLQKTFARHVPIQTALGPDGNPHNRLVSRIYHLKAVEASDGGKNQDMMMPITFCTYPARRRAEFAQAIEQDGYYGEKAVQAWQAALKEWRLLGEQTFETPGGIVRLNPRPGEDRWPQRMRNIANFDYWIEKCEAEQSKSLRHARNLLNNALTSLKSESNLRIAISTCDEAFVAWKAVIAQHGHFLESDDDTQKQLRAVSDAYILRFSKEDQLPIDSPLRGLLAWLDTQGQSSLPK